MFQYVYYIVIFWIYENHIWIILEHRIRFNNSIVRNVNFPESLKSHKSLVKWASTSYKHKVAIYTLEDILQIYILNYIYSLFLKRKGLQ